jgi:hypothetical protein
MKLFLHDICFVNILCTTVQIAAIPQKLNLKFAELWLYNFVQMVRKQKFDIYADENGEKVLHSLSHGTSACNIEIF